MIKSAHEELKEIGFSTITIYTLANKYGIKISKRKMHYVLQGFTKEQLEDEKIQTIVFQVLANHNQLLTNLNQLLCLN